MNILNRPRRLRRTSAIRDLLRENQVTVNDLIYPVFVSELTTHPTPIKSMSGIFQLPLNYLKEELREITALGIKAIILFGVVADRDSTASYAWKSEGLIQQSIKFIKDNFPELIVVVDTCLCEYTNHGHCGLIEEDDHTGLVKNDETLELIAKTALSQVYAGADIIAPSGMMDGMVQVIRSTLDSNSYSHIPIMSYSAKFASAFYGPFREAAQSAPQFGNRCSYQMDGANAREAIKEIHLDIAEGADMVMVKPALAYLDIVVKAKLCTNLPIVTYNVSGEYAMVKSAAENGWIDEQQVVSEILMSMKRAGSDLIISYHAKDFATWIR
jgi:porphobilinogen synthase